MMEAKISRFSDRLNDLLEDKGLSVSRFARETGLKKSSIYDYLNKGASPKKEFFVAVKKTFPEIDLNEFIAGEAGFGESQSDQLSGSSLTYQRKPHKLKVHVAQAGDVDYNAGLMVVPAQQSKKREERFNTIITSCIEEMQQRVVGFSASCYLFGKHLQPGTSKSGTNTPYNRNLKAMEACGIKGKGLTLNSWRHTGASIFTERFGLSIAQRQLGHDDPRTTMIYSKPKPFIKEVAEMKVFGV